MALSPHLEVVVRKMESFRIHVVSPLLLMAICMYVTVEMTDFKYSKLHNVFV